MGKVEDGLFVKLRTECSLSKDSNAQQLQAQIR